MSTFYIEQFGCRATRLTVPPSNVNSSIAAALSPIHHHVADVVVLNTCTVTAAADAQARDCIRKLHATNPASRIIVTGCYAQRAPED